MPDHASSGAHERTLRATFDRAAPIYHEARPRYPAIVFDTVHHRLDIDAPTRALEIGPASGVATKPMAERGHHITAVELGADLAAEAHTRLACFPNVDIVHASFDDWQPPSWHASDLVYAATAWHWLADDKYERAHRHLRPAGGLAFWSARHVVPDDGDPIFGELQSVYEEIGEALPAGVRLPRPGELDDLRTEIEGSGWFEAVTVDHVDWSIEYDADGYLRLLDTFSSHIAMAAWKRARLYEAIRNALAERPRGTLRRHWGAVVHTARARTDREPQRSS